MLLKMIFASFSTMGGTAVDDPDKLAGTEVALENEPDEDSASELWLMRDD